jgi:hypothetical protein
MSDSGGASKAAPNVIRAACRARLYDNLDVLTDIAKDSDEKSADRIRALDTLGRFGLGAADQAAVHIAADGGAVLIGVVHLPALEPVQEGPDEGPGLDENEVARAVKLLTAG